MLKEKNWSKDLEKEIYEHWKEKKVFKFNKKSKKVFSIDTPPPYVNTPVHIGQATTYVLMDMFARFHRMKGFDVLFPLGLDRNGLPIEMAVENKFKVKFSETTREEFLKLCEKVLQESSLATVESFLRLGISFSSWEIGKNIGDVYLTDSPEYRALTQSTFIDLWKKGLIYEANRINNFCPGCQTTIADAEIVYRDLPTIFNDVVFRVKETNEEIVIGTTRPELICTCAMIIFNPEDKRWKHLEGKTAITPIYEKPVPIIAHPLAQIDKGTGLEMMCSAGDQNDIRFFREMNLKPVIAINKDGTMNQHAGFLEGLKIEEARNKIIQELKNRELIRGQKHMLHRTPICERSKHPIEFIAMPEFYLKQVDYKNKMKELANKLNFYDETSRQILLNWIDSITIDWPISRRRYYATEVPLWYCKKCNEPILPEKGKYYQPWKEDCPIKKCPKCGSNQFKGEERVFDTWFDSSITPLYILGYERDDFFENHIPCTLRPQGKEIVRTWLYYTILKCYHLTGKLIFSDAWINYHIVDEFGKKMSKSIGNVIDPKDVLDRFGAEPFRLWCAIEGNLEKTDFRCSFDRIEGAGKTLTKLWNISKFISMFNKIDKFDKKKLLPLDEWIMNEVNSIVKLAEERYERYDFHNPSILTKHFIWETFASHYIEMVKERAYNSNGKFSKEEQEAALYTLYYCLDKILKILAPIIPLMTYKIYKDIYGKDINFEEFPEPEKIKTELKTDEIIKINSEIWKTKKENNLSLKDEIEEAIIPKSLKIIEKDIISAHKIKKLSYGDKLEVFLKQKRE